LRLPRDEYSIAQTATASPEATTANKTSARKTGSKHPKTPATSTTKEGGVDTIIALGTMNPGSL